MAWHSTPILVLRHYKALISIRRRKVLRCEIPDLIELCGSVEIKMEAIMKLRSLPWIDIWCTGRFSLTPVASVLSIRPPSAEVSSGHVLVEVVEDRCKCVVVKFLGWNIALGVHVDIKMLVFGDSPLPFASLRSASGLRVY